MVARHAKANGTYSVRARSYIAFLVTAVLVFFSVITTNVYSAKAATDQGCVNFVQGTDGKRHQEVYWFDFSKCSSDVLHNGSTIEVTKNISDKASVSFNLLLKGTINKTFKGDPMFAAYAPQGKWSALGLANNYSGVNSHKIALGLVQGENNDEAVNANYTYTAEITNIRTTGLDQYGFISADAEQFSDANDVYNVDASGALNNKKPVEYFTSLEGRIAAEDILYGPAIFEEPACADGPTYSNSGVICKGKRNAVEPVFIAKYGKSGEPTKTFTTGFKQSGPSEVGSPNSIALGFVALSRTLTAPEPVKVVDPASLSESEQAAVKAAVVKANPDLEDSAVTVSADGSVSVSGSAKYANGSFTQEQTVFKASAASILPTNFSTDSVGGEATQKTILALTGTDMYWIFTLATALCIIGFGMLSIQKRRS